MIKLPLSCPYSHSLMLNLTIDDSSFHVSVAIVRISAATHWVRAYPVTLVKRSVNSSSLHRQSQNGSMWSWSHMVRMDPNDKSLYGFIRACPATLHGSGPLA